MRSSVPPVASEPHNLLPSRSHLPSARGNADVREAATPFANLLDSPMPAADQPATRQSRSVRPERSDRADQPKAQDHAADAKPAKDAPDAKDSKPAETTGDTKNAADPVDGKADNNDTKAGETTASPDADSKPKTVLSIAGQDYTLDKIKRVIGKSG